MLLKLVRNILLPGLLLLPGAHATEPLICPGGVPLGRFELTVVPQTGGMERDIQSVNRLLPGQRISYRPLEIDTLEKKKARLALLLVPAQGTKIQVFDPKPADQPASWDVPFRTQLAAVVWGPEGLDKAKVASLIDKNNELIGQLADYAAKTEETQALIEAITERQTLDAGQNVNAAVAGFAGRYSSAKIDRTQATDVQLGALIHGVNPSLATYDPLAANPQQQAAQAAGLAAAVAGLFFGNGVGLAASGGAMLVNLSGVLFPRAEFFSALPQRPSEVDKTSVTGLCASKSTRPPHTERAFLWSLRVPDAPAPVVALPASAHAAIGLKTSLPLEVRARDWKLAARIQDWRLVGANDSSIPVAAKVNTTAKTIELDLANDKLKPGIWKLAANWDWDPLPVSGALTLHVLSKFTAAHLTPESQDKLNAGAGTLDLELTGDDFEFVRKIEYKKQGDPFAQPEALPFHLPKEPPDGPETTLKVRLNAKSLGSGNYVFLLAQADGKAHEAPFKVLPAPPAISAMPIMLNTVAGEQDITLHGTGLDRIQQITADHAQITLGEAGDGEARGIRVNIEPQTEAGAFLTLHMQVKDYERPIDVPEAFLIAGPMPAISAVRASSQNNLGVALYPGELAANSLVSFELNTLHAPEVSAVALSCGNSPSEALPLKVKMGDSKEDAKLTRESPDAVFLSFRPEHIGQPGCSVTAALLTPHSGKSAPRKLGTVVLLPRIDSFQLTTDKAGDNAWFGILSGQDLETIAKVGWDDSNGTPVDAIPAAAPANNESLRIAIPWPAPAPHAPLYIWLRGEDKGRLTAARY